ncbi:MAG: DUF262 domain-containing protein [Candidatus Sumerlaeia bacterium]|nr:DUF262 domain-containing protein [Candidatus Sumerlaeia bacterium]
MKIETYSKSIDSLYSPRSRSRINYKPYYQRNYVWDNNKASYFIESILLGTEIPPLIFFDNNVGIEIIDGRQRFETILRFMSNRFKLSPKGVSVLKQLKKRDYDDIAKLDKEIINSFLDSKLRIIEFKLVNEPPLDKYLEDRVKKEIFSRYNSGITPLRRSEIDNAIYDDDDLTNTFKDALKNFPGDKMLIYNLFCRKRTAGPEIPSEGVILSFIRRSLILPLFPINYYARGTDRPDMFAKLYDVFADRSVDKEDEIVKDFFSKVRLIGKVQEYSELNGLDCNRLAFECILWGLGVLEQEGIKMPADDQFIANIAMHIHENYDAYTTEDSAFHGKVMERFKATADFFNDKLNCDTSVYIVADSESKVRIKDLKKPEDAITRLSELEGLRLNKPEPSRNSIEDIVRLMRRRKFLVRPTYQRQEVINPSKSSAIIESILLGITLPAVFIYKRIDGVSEVIDGQQRILTLLGFIGEEYVNEKGKSAFSSNHKFSLRKLRILKELSGMKFDQIDESLREKIYDFQLYVVEIDEKQNPNFNPIDLFIRLNDKPFPIREHSFEMWNSWGDIDIINPIKDLAKGSRDWFYVRKIRGGKDRDRMENEEVLLSLAYASYLDSVDSKTKVFDIFQKTDRINLRLSNKGAISSVLQQLAEDDSGKKEAFLRSIKEVRGFMKKVKYILLDQDKAKDQLFEYLKLELDEMFKSGKDRRSARRTRQDMYVLWLLLSKINFEMVKYHRIEMKKHVKEIFARLKNIPEDLQADNLGLLRFEKDLEAFSEKYSVDERSLRISEDEKAKMIKEQGNRCSISGVPVFLGDDIEIDHNEPLGIGGKDSHENLGVSQADANRSKGVRN